jgi:histidine triad (HIT) family protein
MNPHIDSPLPSPSLSKPDCIFCKLVANEIPANVVCRTETVVVFEDIAPQAPVHWLAVHAHHSDSHSQTQHPQVFAELLEALRLAAAEQGLSDYRLVINNGAGAGQTVFHLHVHLMAGRPLAWPAG